jgi:hypothetical protein
MDSQDDQHSRVQKTRQRAQTNEDNTRWEEKMEEPSWRGLENRRLNVELRSSFYADDTQQYVSFS